MKVINIYKLSVPVGNTTLACDFENSAMCAYTSDPTANFRWILGSGALTPTGTGPSSDHTYGTSSGRYAFLEVSAANRQPGDKARLVSPDYSPSGPQCLEFWYSMYGVDTGTLNVYLESGMNLGSPVFTKQG